MASATRQTTLRRKLRNLNAGRKDRNARSNKGTTPVFPVHTPEADANEASKKQG
jgi:hypothetical protein